MARLSVLVATRKGAWLFHGVNGRQVSDLARPLLPTDELVIVPALSGG